MKRRISIFWITLVSIAAAVLLSGCIGSRAVEASSAYLSPAGWQDNDALLEHDSFDAYATAVRNEVRRFRIPFSLEQAEREIELNSPIELQLGEGCKGQASGIAILVHGLSDTAFSLREIGSVLADVCYKSRVVLLPGHGTRAGDLLTTRLHDWQNTLDYLINQAVSETETVLLVGFSLGGVLTLDAAVQRQNDIDGVIGISPAYHLSSARIARWANLAAPFARWVDRGVADDPMRYEAMPTRGVAETWSAIKELERNLKKYGPVNIPWMLAQSMDDAVVQPEQNEALWDAHALNPNSQLLRFISSQSFPEDSRKLNLPGSSDSDRVIALTHLAVHQSRENPHYGIAGLYRNCGGNMPRDNDGVNQCEQAESVWYGVWDTEPQPGRAMAFSTFNPSFDQFAAELKKFSLKLIQTSLSKKPIIEYEDGYKKKPRTKNVGAAFWLHHAMY